MNAVPNWFLDQHVYNRVIVAPLQVGDRFPEKKGGFK
jgi:hypothetical protein